ncbi:MAG: hypothetical protein JNM63_16675, partial [Spirochaetia bacterium]|nr:hypothetical protein [Spirochaetia bacterium]
MKICHVIWSVPEGPYDRDYYLIVDDKTGAEIASHIYPDYGRTKENHPYEYFSENYETILKNVSATESIIREVSIALSGNK